MSRRHIVTRTFVASAMLCSAVGIVANPQQRVDAASRSARLVPTSGALFGAWIRSDVATVDGFKNAILERETQIGRSFDIVNHFYSFSNEFPLWHETWDISSGRTPMISWNGTSSAAINRGDHDALIRTRARAVAALGAPVFMRWFWEMDGSNNAVQAGTPVQYIAAWKRIRSMFIAEGATNAIWTWCPNAWGFEHNDAQQWYPGDAEVEWICADGYNWAPTLPTAEWRSWNAIFADAHAFAVAHNKPLMVGEFGALERAANEKSNWYTAARAAVKAMPNIAAVVAFDERKYRSDENRWYDWRVDSTASSLLAYSAWGRDPYFNTLSALLVPTIAFGDGIIYETDGTDVIVAVPITLSEPSLELITVQASTAPLTADTTDFVSQTRNVKFNPGVVRVFMQVRVRAETIDEPNEVILLNLTAPVGANLERATGTITIRDDDPGSGGLRIAVGDASIVEGNSVDRTLQIPVTLSRDATTTVTLKYAVTSTAALRNADWLGPLSGTVTFNAGQNLKHVIVRVLPDFLDETNETVTVTLSAPVGATITDAAGIATILDDD